MGRPFVQVPDLRQAWVVLHLDPIRDNTLFNIYVEGTFPDVVTACEACKQCRGRKAYALKDQTLPAIPLADQKYALLDFTSDWQPEVVACYRDYEQVLQAQTQALTDRSRCIGMIGVRRWVCVGRGRSL